MTSQSGANIGHMKSSIAISGKEGMNRNSVTGKTQKSLSRMYKLASGSRQKQKSMMNVMGGGPVPAGCDT